MSFCAWGGGTLDNEELPKYQNESKMELAIYLEDIQANTLPRKEDGYFFSIEKSNCTSGAKIEWDENSWSPIIRNVTETRTKCKMYFSNQWLKDYGINESVIKSGDGIYQINHDNAVINAPLSELEKNNLKNVEYRYAGGNVNNYVSFNNESWRIIGLVNTPEGARFKIIRNEPIGNYSWDSSDVSVNNGWGINEWSQSKLKQLLNEGAYWNRTSGLCYFGENNVTQNCDFSSTGLTSTAKQLIDIITWNVGSLPDTADKSIEEFYNLERGNFIGTSCNQTIYCTDKVPRTTLWKGAVGLLYPSDQGYSITDTDTLSHEECLSSGYSLGKCKSSSWLFRGQYQFTMTPTDHDGKYNSFIAHISSGGSIFGNGTAMQTWLSYPVVYLKSNVYFYDGNGTFSTPYKIKLK